MVYHVAGLIRLWKRKKEKRQMMYANDGYITIRNPFRLNKNVISRNDFWED